MSNVVQLDDYRPIAELMKNRLNTSKFLVVCFLEEDINQCATLVPAGVSELEFMWMMKCLKEREAGYQY